MVLWTSVIFCSLIVWSCRQCSCWSDAQFSKVYILFVYNTAFHINRCPRHPNDLSAEVFQSCALLPKLYFSVSSLARHFFTWCKKINEALRVKTHSFPKLKSFPKDSTAANSNSGYIFFFLISSSVGFFPMLSACIFLLKIKEKKLFWSKEALRTAVNISSVF